jgi:hypothetical protein
MALKYYFEFTDVKEVLHRCEIYDADFIGDAIEINGSLNFSSGSVSNSLEPIRGVGLNISLEASTSLDFTDLYSENEFTYQVVYIRNSITLFDGFLEPEGLYQSYVSDKWIINLVCVDGLSFLKNLSYVEDSTGLTFTGKQKEIEIISNSLKRTKVLKNINVSVNVYYTGLATDVCVLDNVYLNSSRFIKDDNDTIMNCDEVLRSILEPYNAILLQYNNEWYIFRLSELIANDTLSFFKFDSDGVYDSMNNDVDFRKTLGSQINSFYPHWCNGNQQLTLKSSIAAARINYKYGLVNSFVSNTTLANNGTIITDYTITDGTYIDLLPSNGFTINASPSTPVKVLEITDTYAVVASDSLSIETIINTDSVEVVKTMIQIKLVGSSTYYLDFFGVWQTYPTYVTFRANLNEITQTIKSEEYPISGDISLEIYTNDVFVEPGDPAETGESINYYQLRLFPNELTLIEGENHTVQRETKPSTKIKDTIEVFNGDNVEDRYVGTIYKNDEETTTSTWFRKDIVEELPLLRIMGEEVLRINANPSKIFSGDVFGFVSFFSVISIDGLTGKYFPIECNYNALNNTTSLKLVEVFTDELLDINYSLTYDYGNVVEPTIKG